MEKPAFTIRLSSETGQTIEELAKLLGVTKNKLLSAILEESRDEMQEMIGYLKLLEIPLNSPYSNLHASLKDVIINAARTEKENIDKQKSVVTIPKTSSEEKEVPTYFSRFLEK